MNERSFFYASMKRKSKAEPTGEPKEKKQRVTFKAPTWYAYGFSFDDGDLKWRWYRQLPILSHYTSKTTIGTVMSDAAWDDFHEHMGFTCRLRPPTWCFAPEIEQVVFAFFFGSTLRGLAGIIAAYAEIVFPGKAAMLTCEHDSSHEDNICLVGDWHPTRAHPNDSRPTEDAAWKLLRKAGCDMCANASFDFDVPYPTADNVI